VSLAGGVEISLAHQSLYLLASGSIYWPLNSILFVADLHLGKAATYRQLGQPVPQGTTTQTLNKLTHDLALSGAQHLVVLGDFLHAALVHRSPSTLAVLNQWRAQHARLKITLVRGNHDDSAGDPGADLRIDIVNEPWVIEPFTLRHDPASAKIGESWLAGHAHPVTYLRGRGRDRLRLPCFVVGPRSCVLPAFGAFTGGHLHQLQAGECLYVLAQEQVYKVPGQP
jgi:uncharacterized protein